MNKNHKGNFEDVYLLNKYGGKKPRMKKTTQHEIIYKWPLGKDQRKDYFI